MSIFSETHRHVTVTTKLRSENLMMMRAIHRLQKIFTFLLIEFHWREHALFVMRQMSGLLIKLALGDMRRANAQITGSFFGFFCEFLYLIGDDGSARRPKRQTRPYVFRKNKQIQLLSEFPVIPFFCLFEHFQMILQLGF